MKSATHFNALVGSRIWDKELVMWIGSEKAIHQALGSANCLSLDLLDLFDVGNLPTDDDSSREH